MRLLLVLFGQLVLLAEGAKPVFESITPENVRNGDEVTIQVIIIYHL